MKQVWLRAAAVAVVAAAAFGQELPIEVLRVRIGAVSGGATRGELTLRPESGEPWRCRFDERTWFESRRVRVDAAAFGAGDAVEVLAERRAGNGECYARTVRMADFSAAPASTGRPVYRSVTEHIIPRQSESVAGIVTAITRERVQLRLRGAGSKELAIRGDTRFFEAGVEVDRERLRLNDRVFVRGGRTPEGSWEAYQVIWGEIVTPK